MKTITIHSFKGGTGKTNIIANLALAFANSGFRVGVVDSDMAHPSLHIIFGLGNKQPHPTLTEFLLDKCSAVDIVHDVSHLYNLRNKLYLIPSNLDEETITRIIRGGFEIGHLFRGLREIGKKKNLDLLLIDTKPGLDEKTMLFLMMTDMLLIALRNDEADVRGTKTLLNIVEHFKVPIKCIIPNMAHNEHSEELLAELKRQFADDSISIMDPLPYSTTLAVEHSPHIDKLFIDKYPNDAFSQSILTLRGLVTKKLGIEAQ